MSLYRNLHEKSEQKNAEQEELSKEGNLSGTLLGILGASAVTGGIGYLMAKNRYERHTEDLKNSYHALARTDTFRSDPSSFAERFSELSLISPTVASNPALAKKIITPRLAQGFDLDDIHRLSAVEYHSTNTRRAGDPTSEGFSQAADAFTKGVRNVAPVLVAHLMAPRPAPSKPMVIKMDNGKQIKAAPEKIHQAATERSEELLKRNNEIVGADKMEAILKTLGAIKKDDDMDKKGSAQESAGTPENRVSDECLGRMMAERYVLYKTAAGGGVLSSMEKVYGKLGLNKGVKALKDQFGHIVPALVVGGGIQLLREVMKERENDKLRAQADQVFAQLRRQSASIQGNPQVAAEAFDTLKSFAPSIAAKPLVAKSFIEGIVSAEQLPVDTAALLARTEQTIRDNGGSDKGFLEGLKTPMSFFSMSVGPKKDNKAPKRPKKKDGPGQ